MHRLLPATEIRRIESAALAATAPGELMARAASAVADAAERQLRAMPAGRRVLAFCGPGNNGGDALLAALLLHGRGYEVQAFELADAALVTGGQTVRPAPPDAVRVRERAAREGLEPHRLASREDMRALLAQGGAVHDPGALVLDGLFGIGLTRPLTGLAAALCELLTASGLPVIAIDVPSGIDADTGALVGGEAGAAIRAIETVTMIADKPGLHTGAALDYAGRVTLAKLGVPAREETVAAGTLFDCEAAASLLPARARDTSKGSFGSVLVIGGAPGMHGAALLAALGAQHSGAGKVWIAAPAGAVFDPGQPQLMTRDPDADFGIADVLVAGCGLGTDARAGALLARVLASGLPAVLDADALNLLAGAGAAHDTLRQTWRAPHDAACILTPHPLEAARLLGCSAREVQADRVASAKRLAQAHGCVVALKGAGTVVAGPSGRWCIVAAGGPALASAGTGDVLAGVIGGLLAQKLEPFEAALLGCWTHGDAGDRWSQAQGRGAGLSAAELPALIRHSLACLSWTNCR
jgi:hydroxyethylthiazole kinase-like uncharacterized protein yjeF